jgi:hypothetical protein
VESKVIRVPRWLVSSLSALFSIFHAALGYAALSEYQAPIQGAVAVTLYLLAVIATAVFYRGLKLPTSQALINLAVSIFVPYLINLNLDPTEASGHATWYVIGVATLLAGTAVRQQVVIAWIGTAILVFQEIIWAGFLVGWQTGLAGALMLVFAGHAISKGIERAAKSAQKYTQQALEDETQIVVSKSAALERRNRLELALVGALPMLKIIESQNGKLTDSQKIEARLLEASLRDEIRGRELLNDEVRSSVRDARNRGIEVVILDEGGVDQLSPDSKKEILTKVCAAIKDVEQGRVTLRAPLGESWNVTLVATRPGVAKPDIWLKF